MSSLFDGSRFLEQAAEVCDVAAVQLPSSPTVAALSGGVDSTVAAAFAVAAGVDVVGVTLLLWGGDRVGRSCSTADVGPAAAAASALGIEHVTVDLREEFTASVIVPFRQAAVAGRTDNPCVACNRAFKLSYLTSWLTERSFDWLVTGHHASMVDTAAGRLLARSVDEAKDQSYVLYTAERDALDRLMLPLGTLDKSQVRRIATLAGFVQADAADSMDLCFDPAEVLSGVGSPASVVDTDGRTFGEVPSTTMVTLGQRRGFGVNTFGRYVTDVDVTSSTVTLGPLEDLFIESLTLSTPHLVVPLSDGHRVWVQMSAHGDLSPAAASMSPQGLRLEFDSRVRRAAPGQHAVVYVAVGDRLAVAGGGVI